MIALSYRRCPQDRGRIGCTNERSLGPRGIQPYPPTPQPLPPPEPIPSPRPGPPPTNPNPRPIEPRTRRAHEDGGHSAAVMRSRRPPRRHLPAARILYRHI